MEPGAGRGPAGTVLTSDGRWAYRYKDGADLILMKMPERPAPASECSSEARTESGAGLACWLAQLCIHLVRKPFRV